MSLDPAEFASTIRRIRKDRNLSQQELGDMVGVTNAAISQFELAKTMPYPGTFVSLAAALNVSVGVLVGDPLAVAEYTVAQVRAEVRALGYDIALMPREDRA